MCSSRSPFLPQINLTSHILFVAYTLFKIWRINHKFNFANEDLAQFKCNILLLGPWAKYALHSQLSEKGDTYSFGIVVLEIISGKKNSDVKVVDDDGED